MKAGKTIENNHTGDTLTMLRERRRLQRPLGVGQVRRPPWRLR
jgi:hypothetical protein